MLIALVFSPLLPGICVAAGHSVADASRILGVEPTELQAAFPYRGVIGRVDSAIVRAAIPKKRGGFPTEYLTLGADPACNSPRLAEASQSASANDYVISLVFPPSPARPNDSAVAIVLANPELHERIREQAENAASRVRLLGVHANSGVSIPEPSPGRDIRLRIEYPDVANVSLDGRTVIAGPARIVVTRAGEPIPFAKLAQSCRATARDEDFRPLICIDELFFDAINRCGLERVDLHPGVCHFVGAGKRTSFADHCFPGQGASTHPAKCKGEPDALEYIVAPTCRSVLMEFSWQEILDAGDLLVKRRVRGSTFLSSAGHVEDGPVRIPGPEFLGVFASQSTKEMAVTDFFPAKQGADADTLTLDGIVDQSESTLLFHPRMMVARVCKDGLRKGQACAGLEKGVAMCACDSIRDAECACEMLPAKDARYFTCKNTRELDDLPCTRARHCWKSKSKIGGCSGRPKCLPLGSVWKPDVEPEGEYCSLDDDCPADMQCGYSLFDFAARSDHPSYEIQASVHPTSKQRGNCRRFTTKVCGGDKGLCTAREGECIGYRAEALNRVQESLTGDLDFPSELFHKEVPPGIVIGPNGVPDESHAILKELERTAEEGEVFY
jgi:hypothetical protein